MSYESKTFDEEPLVPARQSRARLWNDGDGTSLWPQKRQAENPERSGTEAEKEELRTARGAQVSAHPRLSKKASARSTRRWPALKNGHALSFAGLFLFTAVTYFRPYELVPALAGFKSMAFWLAVLTLFVYVPTQLSVEGTLTYRPREVNLLLLLALMGLLSIPTALVPAEAWTDFVDYAKVVTMFIVMVNVVRSEMRLRAMFWLALMVGLVLGFNALNDYRQGILLLGGNRIKGALGGMFDNPNDMALYLVTMVPLALGLLFVARGLSKKIGYGVLALLMVSGVVVSFSRGAFMALAAALLMMAWKLGRRNRMAVMALFVVVVALFFLLVPSDYLGRLGSTLGGKDWGSQGSANARQNLLIVSILVTLRHPLFGIGMHNFHNVSIREQVSHNAYTQVSAEMGVAALIFYVLFMVAAIRRMSAIERETYETRSETSVYYLAVGLQGCIVAYMVSSFFASVAYLWYIYYLVGYTLCLHRLYEAKGAGAIFRSRAERRKLISMEHPADAPPAQFPPLATERQQL